MRNSELHGYNPDLFNRDNCETGFLNQKFFPANYRQTLVVSKMNQTQAINPYG